MTYCHTGMPKRAAFACTYCTHGKTINFTVIYFDKTDMKEEQLVISKIKPW